MNGLSNATNEKPLNIFEYSGKNDTFYRLAYFNNKFMFVHIDKNIWDKLEVKKSIKGRFYHKYVGSFEYNENHIYIK